MIEHCDSFTYLGTLFTHQHEVQLFEEGLLILSLDEPLPAKLAPCASNTPVLPLSCEGWHPASRQRSARVRWSFVNADWQRQFLGQLDGRRSLPTAARAFIDGRFDAQPALKGVSAPPAVDLVLCFPVYDAWQVLHWRGALFTPDFTGSPEDAIDNLRHASLAPVHDDRAIRPLGEDRYLGQVPTGERCAHVFTSGLYLQEAASPDAIGWYPLRTTGANLLPAGAELLLKSPWLGDALAKGFAFQLGQFDAPHDPRARYAWIGVDEQGERQGFMVFDHPLLAPDSPGFDAHQGEVRARAVREAGHFAAGVDPINISHIDQLGRGTCWNVCGFVAAIQAAWYHAARHDLFKPTSHATLAPVIAAFLTAHAAKERDYLRASDAQLSFGELARLIAQDERMVCSSVALGLLSTDFEGLLTQFGVRNMRMVTLGEAAPLREDTLPERSATYTLTSVAAGPAGCHQVYVTPQGQHLLWGRACTTAQVIECVHGHYDGVANIVQFD